MIVRHLLRRISNSFQSGGKSCPHPLVAKLTGTLFRLRERYVEAANYRMKVEAMYNDYRRNFCSVALLEPKKRAEFGKMVRMAFPCIRKRRLGPAGGQVSYYVGIALRNSEEPQQILSITPTLHPTSHNSLHHHTLHHPPAVDEGILEKILWDMHGDESLGVESVSYAEDEGNVWAGGNFEMISNTATLGGTQQQPHTFLPGDIPAPWLDSTLPTYSFFFSDILADGVEREACIY